MTTILAIASIAFFYKNAAYLAMASSIILGFLQFHSKVAMNRMVAYHVSKGQSPIDAANNISDRATIINMLLSFAVWGLFMYSLYLELIK